MSSSSTINFGQVPVGPDHQPFIIAEMSGNHNGDLERAKDIVRAMAETGVQALKLQTYTADTITLDVDLPAFRLPSEHKLWADARLYDLYEEAHTPWEWHEPIFALAHELGMEAFSSPFDPTAIDFLEKLNVPAYKVASNEIGDLPLVRGSSCCPAPRATRPRRSSPTCAPSPSCVMRSGCRSACPTTPWASAPRSPPWRSARP